MQVMKTGQRLEFLIEFTQMSPGEIRLNKEVFQWLQRMPRLIEEAHKIMDDTSQEQKKALTVD